MKSEELFVLTEGEELFRTELKNRLARDKKFQDIINRTLLIKDFDRQLFWEAFNFFKNAGYSAYGIPEEYGGFPASSRGSVILTEELCALDASIGLSLGATISLVASPILHWGTEEQKKFWLPKIVAGEVLGCYCQTEPNSGSDVASIQGRAVLRNGVWHITKSSRFITNGTEANLALVLVRTASRQEDVHYGLTMFIVDLERAKRERQASTPRNEVKAGLHLSPTSEVIFDDCVADDILGELHHGWAVAMSTLVGSRATSIAAQGIGVGRAAWELARDYAIGRMQFGLKLEEIPQQRKRLQKMETAVHMARLLAWRSAMLRDEKGARDSRPWECEASQAKLFSSEMAEWAPSEAMQLMGGVGYIMEAKAAKFWHDGRIVKIYEGTSDIQCTIIMHRLLERFGKELTWLAAPRISAVTRWPHARRLAVVWPVSKDEEEEMNRVLAQNLKNLPKLRQFKDRLLDARGAFLHELGVTLKQFALDFKGVTFPSPYFGLSYAFSALEGAKLSLWELAFRAGKDDQRISRADIALVQRSLTIAKQALGKVREYRKDLATSPELREEIEGKGKLRP